ncbi:M15 family peptidase [Microbispora cellulosiformans]|uniref:M15 family peptidase n=2 Tax=Microbispora TaxID=2005 RepID=A0A5J5K7B5_9ACTN|nr:M15 family metallopeptidase [Microbispora cellulosiformans]KAA9379185.1 M15 family peptidase [Microbispora cellulosiformans]
MGFLKNRRSAVMIATLVGVTGCGGAAGPEAGGAASAPARTSMPAAVTSPAASLSPVAATPVSTDPVSATPSATPTPSAPEDGGTPSPSGPPAFSSKIEKVSRDELRHSWRPGCPVAPSGLRKITMTYWGFDDKAHTGTLVVNKSVAEDVASVFGKLYDMRYPIRRMEPVDVYKGSDFDSIEVDNTSAFNCRNATGSGSWSNHAYGLAVDLNPRENPYVEADGSNAHRNADAFVDRPLKKPGVINRGDRVVRAFASIGWGWGGTWSGARDYQHFSVNGR